MSLCFVTGRNSSSQKCLWVTDNDAQFVFCSLRTSQSNFSSFLSIASINLQFGICLPINTNKILLWKHSKLPFLDYNQSFWHEVQSGSIWTLRSLLNFKTWCNLWKFNKLNSLLHLLCELIDLFILLCPQNQVSHAQRVASEMFLEWIISPLWVLESTKNHQINFSFPFIFLLMGPCGISSTGLLRPHSYLRSPSPDPFKFLLNLFIIFCAQKILTQRHWGWASSIYTSQRASQV